MRGTTAGKSYVDPAVAGKLIEQVSTEQPQPSAAVTDKLTEREMDVLRLLARGLNNTEIAAKLHLSEGTVRNHVSRILQRSWTFPTVPRQPFSAIQHGLDR